jgi:hypothetical protein
MTTIAKTVQDHLKVSKTVRVKALRSPKAAKALLVRVGILTKSGKKLAKPYR